MDIEKNQTGFWCGLPETVWLPFALNVKTPIRLDIWIGCEIFLKFWIRIGCTVIIKFCIWIGICFFLYWENSAAVIAYKEQANNSSTSLWFFANNIAFPLLHQVYKLRITQTWSDRASNWDSITSKRQTDGGQLLSVSGFIIIIALWWLSDDRRTMLPNQIKN